MENTPVEISAATIDDCEAIISLQRLAYESEARLYDDWSLPALTQTAESLKDEFGHSLILKAVTCKKIIGSVRATCVDGVCHIGRLIVHPEFQQRGIGTELLQTIEACCGQVTHYELFTGDKSLDNIRLYQREGYTLTHTHPLSEKVSLVYLRKPARV